DKLVTGVQTCALPILASKLIEGMTAKWNASKFHDEYRDALMKLIERKVKSGQTEAIEDVEAEEAPVAQTINFMDVLKRSVEHAEKGKTKSAARIAKPKGTTRT